ncbi:hypothetical protein [Bacillus sp. FJAT-45037]|uniref:hypothetical protein n=1 Tax=Bacillus sp. FJAT-45037 TaxID=2011007 RepID=UPI0018E26CC6|nr:hypothetical protein [Bacillus sp. FJAT-45037]
MKKRKNYASETKSLRQRVKEELNAQFENPLLHRAINNEEVIVPLDVERLWLK